MTRACCLGVMFCVAAGVRLGSNSEFVGAQYALAHMMESTRS